LSENGFNVSIQTEASNAGGAITVWTDPRAVQNLTVNALGFETPNNMRCELQVYDFCLTGAENFGEDRWGFNFTIRVEQNTACGSLTATIDLVRDDSVYFANAVIDGDSILDAFNCGEDRVITVYADYDGAPGEIYGQIDIRNGQQEVVQISDSCVWELI
jgi:hypothetical protein